MRISILGSPNALITFWGESDELIKKIGLNNNEDTRLMCADTRVSTYGTYTFGHSFQGKFIPMCMDKLINAFRRKGLNPLLFKAVRTYNFRIKTLHDNT